MHEFSIAVAILELVQRHLPPGGVLRRVKVRAGRLRAIDPEVMQAAWPPACTTLLGSADVPSLDFQSPPLLLRCPGCRREWHAEELFQTCTCGQVVSECVGGDELTLLSLTVDLPEDKP